jgi:upstream activation factor subunit UAF30
MKPLTPSKDLAAIVGSKALPRTEVVKKLWAYIKKNNLQDPKNKRNIKADSKLKPVFGGKKLQFLCSK